MGDGCDYSEEVSDFDTPTRQEWRPPPGAAAGSPPPRRRPSPYPLLCTGGPSTAIRMSRNLGAVGNESADQYWQPGGPAGAPQPGEQTVQGNCSLNVLRFRRWRRLVLRGLAVMRKAGISDILEEAFQPWRRDWRHLVFLAKRPALSLLIRVNYSV